MENNKEREEKEKAEQDREKHEESIIEAIETTVPRKAARKSESQPKEIENN